MAFKTTTAPSSLPDSSSLPSQLSFTRRLLHLNDNGENGDHILQKHVSKPKKRLKSETQPSNDDRRRSFIGRDILKRQSQLESRTVVSAEPPTLPVLNYAKEHEYEDKHSQIAPSSPGDLSLSQDPMGYKTGCFPTFAPNPNALQLQIDTNIKLPPDQVSICNSPTWDKKKKEKPERTKKQDNISREASAERKGQAGEQTARQSKKLSKKPPSAMQTQRRGSNNAELIANTESALTDRRPSSSGGSFTQAMKGLMSRRSSQTNSLEASRPPSSHGLFSQSRDLRNEEALHLDEDSRHVKEMIKSSTRRDESTRAGSSSKNSSKPQLVRSTTFPAPLTTPPQSRGHESVVYTASEANTREDLPRSTSVPVSISRIFGKKDNAAGGYAYPNINHKVTKDNRLSPDTKPGGTTWFSRSATENNLKSAHGISTPRSSTALGYVQRERLAQQQRSIARFEDEIAVKSAYESFLTESQLPPTPKDSTESVESSSEVSVSKPVSQQQQWPAIELASGSTKGSKQKSQAYENIRHDTPPHILEQFQFAYMQRPEKKGSLGDLRSQASSFLKAEKKTSRSDLRQDKRWLQSEIWSDVQSLRAADRGPTRSTQQPNTTTTGKKSPSSTQQIWATSTPSSQGSRSAQMSPPQNKAEDKKLQGYPFPRVLSAEPLPISAPPAVETVPKEKEKKSFMRVFRPSQDKTSPVSPTPANPMTQGISPPASQESNTSLQDNHPRVSLPITQLPPRTVSIPLDGAKPIGTAMQPDSFTTRNHSLPNKAEQSSSSTNVNGQYRDSGLAWSPIVMTSQVQATQTTQKSSASYQLPPLLSTETSPLFPASFDSDGGSEVPPVLDLNHNQSGLMSSASHKSAVNIPAPPSTAPPPPPPTAIKPRDQAELLIASTDAEGLVRSASLKRHRSDPQMKLPTLTVKPPQDLPSLDFLPELKHQPLIKPKRTTRANVAPGSPTGAPLSPSQFPIPSPSSEITRRPGGGVRARHSNSSNSGTIAKPGPAKPMAKMFVICCKCKFWHDLPSRIYEAMALPQSVRKEDDIADIKHKHVNGNAALPEGKVHGLEGKIFTQVKCPWCEHGMSTSCCEGWTTVIYLHQRHH